MSPSVLLSRVRKTYAAGADAWNSPLDGEVTRRGALSAKLPFTDIKENVTYGREAVAWFRMPDVRWTGLNDGQRMSSITEHAHGYAQFVGKTIQMRGTVRPMGARRWRDMCEAEMRKHGTPPDDDALAERLNAEEEHLRKTGTSTMEWFLGVPFASRSLVDRAWTEAKKGITTSERAKVAEALEDVTENALGFGCASASHPEVVWLAGQSVGLHLPQRDASEVFGSAMGPDDLPSLTDGVELVPAGKYTRILAHPEHTGLDGTREVWVAVLSIGRMERQVVPGSHKPLVALSQALPFPTEWNLLYDVVPGERAAAEVKKKIDGALDNKAQLEDHGLQVDPETQAVSQIGRKIRHEMSEGDQLTSTRVRGTLRVAVAGKDRRDAEKKVKALTRLYRGQRISVAHPRGQLALVQEFLPGAKRATTAHTRRGPVATFAAMVPTMTALVGDNHGLPLGRTTGTVSRAVLWDMFAALYYGESSGYTPIIGGLGAGKTTLLAYLLGHGVLGGALGTAIDPTGVLARLAEILPDSEVLDLLGSSEPGILSPWSSHLVPIPRRGDFGSIELWRQAKDDAARRRMNLARDAITGLLPGEFFDPGTHARMLVSTAIAKVGGEVGVTRAMIAAELKAEHAEALLSITDGIEPDEVLHLEDLIDGITDVGAQMVAEAVAAEILADEAKSMELVAEALDKDPLYSIEAQGIAAYLRSIATDPRVRMFYAPCETARNLTAASLLVIKMVGMALPEVGTPEREWTDDERLGVVLLNAASFLATARVFDIPKWVPKVLVLDETHFLSKTASGRQLQQRLIRTCRDRRTRVLGGTHLVDDVLLNQGGMLCEEVFVGKTTDEQYQQGCLRILRQLGNGEILGALGKLSGLKGDESDATRPREFFFRDSRGRVERIIIDLRHWPRLLEVLSPPTTKLGKHHVLQDVTA